MNGEPGIDLVQGLSTGDMALVLDYYTTRRAKLKRTAESIVGDTEARAVYLSRVSEIDGFLTVLRGQASEVWKPTPLANARSSTSGLAVGPELQVPRRGPTVEQLASMNRQRANLNRALEALGARELPEFTIHEGATMGELTSLALMALARRVLESELDAHRQICNPEYCMETHINPLA